jgi:hypothetical protein
MSGLPPLATELLTSLVVRFVPKAEVKPSQPLIEKRLANYHENRLNRVR